jgi:hypothetical protein
MDNHYRDRIDALLISTLAMQRLDIQDAFRKRHGSLIDKQSYLIVEAKIREHRTWLAMTKIVDGYFSEEQEENLKVEEYDS